MPIITKFWLEGIQLPEKYKDNFDVPSEGPLFPCSDLEFKMIL